MAIADEIQRIKTNIANAYTELENKGATIPEVKNSENLANTITTVSSGGSTVTKGIIINAFDSDGYATDVSIVGMTDIPTKYMQEYDEIAHTVLGKITTLTFDNNLSTIGSSAFEYNNYIQNIIIPETVTKIWGWAFGYCKKAKRIEILAGGELTLNTRAFAYTGGLTELVFRSTTPPVLSASISDVFYYSGLTYGTAYIYVPDEALETYKKATNYTTWASNIKPMSELPTE